MEDKIKWADVAHYYHGSNIGIRINGEEYDRTFLMVSYRNVGGSHFEKWVNEGVYWRGYGSQFVKWDSHKPILRNLEDMTEAEDNECMLVHTRNVEGEEFKRVVWDLAKHHDILNQYSTHWLISRGFDVFGLIESGQAIRKEVGNG